MSIELSDGKVLEQDGIMAVDTMLGTLYVERTSDLESYPGFYISLRRPGGKDFVPLLVEVDQDDPAEPRFKVHYWSPENHFDDPVWDARLTAEEIDSTWKEQEP